MSGGSAPHDLSKVNEGALEEEDRTVHQGLSPNRHDSKIDRNRATADASQDTVSGSAARDVPSTNEQSVAHNAFALHALNTSIPHSPLAIRSSKSSTPGSAALHIKTNIGVVPRLKETPTVFETPVPSEGGLHEAWTSPSSLPAIGSSLRSNLSASSMTSSLSPGSASGSALPSPYLATMSDLTPLPSPMMLSDLGSGSWRRSQGQRSRAGSTDDPTSVGKPMPQFMSLTSPPKRKKGYGSLLHDAMESNATAAEEHARVGKDMHGRHRSISDFVPEHLHNLRQRHVTFGPGDGAAIEAHEYHMQRERYLASQRGLTIPLDAKQQRQLPSPPHSTSSVAESDEADDEPSYLEDGTAAEYLEIHCGIQNKRRKFRQLRQLGQGTFSKVTLATRERLPAHVTPEIEDHLNPHRLVAVKIVEHGPAGGADAERIETGLKREVEMLKSVVHPSIIHLKACEYQVSRALLVLTYCPGGDLFELASQKRDVLGPSMVQRIFAELVSAVRYLHVNWIVHRDIKLENVLVNLPYDALKGMEEPLTHATPIVTLTDLGLSRRIPEPPEAPLLHTRCGSEDYAAPEILLGQPYDGRQTDAWALGVLLYALMEGRLPFDAPPGKPDRSRNTHRIARCDWIWCRFGDDDGEWDPTRGTEFAGARPCVEGLLKKVRMGRKALEQIQDMDWVRTGIQVPGGLKMREEDEDDALL